MKSFLKDLLLIIVIAVIVLFIWQGLEIIEFGKVRPSFTDSIIGLVLIYSIYGNIKFGIMIRKIIDID